MDFEAALREACIEADKTYWKSFFEHIDSMPEILIPKDKDERLREFIRNYRTASETEKKNRNGMTRGIKVLLIAAIILLAIAVTAFAFEPFRNFVYRVYTDCTEFVFESVKGNKDDYLYAKYSYIPKGYKLVQNNKTKTSQKIIYENESNQIVIQTDMGSSSVLGIDTENAEYGDLDINGYDGYYSINQTSIIVAWSTGRNHHVICADRNSIMNLDDVVHIAQSATGLH